MLGGNVVVHLFVDTCVQTPAHLNKLSVHIIRKNSQIHVDV
jgi:hypothetical protein